MTQSIIHYSDFIESFSHAKNTAIILKESIEKAKIEYDEQSLKKEIRIIFFGYDFLLDNKSFLERSIFMSKDSSERDIHASLNKIIKNLRLSKYSGNKLSGIGLYLTVKDFYKKMDVDNILSVMNSNNGIFNIHGDHYSIGVSEQVADNQIEFGDFIIDLSK